MKFYKIGGTCNNLNTLLLLTFKFIPVFHYYTVNIQIFRAFQNIVLGQLTEMELTGQKV